MKAKDWLMRARHLEGRIESLLEARARIYDQATSSTSRVRDTPTSGGAGMPDDKMAGYASVGEEIEEQRKRLDEVRVEIIQVIGQIEDNTSATLLTEYYINDKTWNEVARGMNYSFAHVTKVLHPKALRLVEKMLINTNSICGTMVLSKKP